MSARASHAREVFDAHVRGLPREVQLQLIALITEAASHDAAASAPAPRVLDLVGVGAEIWQGVDAQAYVDELRGEWVEAR